jgi:hypothetical protein
VTPEDYISAVKSHPRVVVRGFGGFLCHGYAIRREGDHGAVIPDFLGKDNLRAFAERSNLILEVFRACLQNSREAAPSTVARRIGSALHNSNSRKRRKGDPVCSGAIRLIVRFISTLILLPSGHAWRSSFGQTSRSPCQNKRRVTGEIGSIVFV